MTDKKPDPIDMIFSTDPDEEKSFSDLMKKYLEIQTIQRPPRAASPKPVGLISQLLEVQSQESVTSDLLARISMRRESETEKKVSILENEISELQKAISDKANELIDKKESISELRKRLEDLNQQHLLLLEKQTLSHLLNRVCEPARKVLLESKDFQAQFNQTSPCNAFVLSIDVRRSTELMLKARNPKLFAEFIINLANQMRQVILDRFGMFDKFTGDGILAVFPEFLSGNDAGFLAIQAASECHKIFEEWYTANWSCFLSILKDVGLGIGLDYGQVQIVQVGGEITAVGTPVVYACRMGGCPPSITFVNRPAYEVLFEKYSEYCDFNQDEINIKNEGLTIGYSIKFNGKKFQPINPPWLKI